MISTDIHAPAGRPLDSTRDGDLRRAALELVAEIGYDRLTIDAVAARVKAGKATVYRRWASKADLVVDAFVEEMFGNLVAPDTGSIRDDLLSISTQIWVETGSVPRAQVLAGLMSSLLDKPELREALNSCCHLPQRILEEVIENAVVRGEIPRPTDVEVIGSIMPGVCMFRLLRTGSAPDREFFETVIDRVLVPALGGADS